MARSHTPQYVYKLVATTAEISDPLPERLPVSAIDKESGFIHLSTADQLLGTLNNFFSNEDVYVLRLCFESVMDGIRWETPEVNVCGPREGEGEFPHLYNGLKLGADEIDSKELWKRDGKQWDEVVNDANKRGWLV